MRRAQLYRAAVCPGTEIENDDLLPPIRQDETEDEPVAGRMERLDHGADRQIEKEKPPKRGQRAARRHGAVTAETSGL